MRKGHKLIGLKVLSQTDGADLGQVRDLVFDHEANQCIALVLSERALFGMVKAQIVLWSEIAAIGSDAVMVTSEHAKISANDVTRVKELMEAETALSGTKIYTEDGQNLGSFADVYLDEATGKVVGYEMSGGFVSDTMTGKRYMPADHDLVAGSDTILVSSSVAGELEAQAQNEPGGLKGAAQSAGERIGDVYGSAKDKVTDAYANVADASIDKQKEFVVGKVAGNDVFFPAPSVTDGATLVKDTTSPGTVALATTVTPKEHGPLLVAQGDTITSAQADQAETAGILHALVLAAGGALASSTYEGAKDKVSGATSGVLGTVQEKTGGVQQNAEEAAIGKQAGTEVNLPNGSTLLAPGMIVTREIMDAATTYGKDKEVIASAGIGSASQGAQNAAATVQEKAGGLWDAIKGKTAELTGAATGAAHDKKEEYDAVTEKRAIDNALGRPVTRVILAQDDSIILNTGDLITHKAIDQARRNDVLDVLVGSVYDEAPDITPEMMRVEGKGTAALASQQEPTRGPITATVSPETQSQSTPSQDA